MENSSVLIPGCWHQEMTEKAGKTKINHFKEREADIWAEKRK
jgi:hypothetical protein